MRRIRPLVTLCLVLVSAAACGSAPTATVPVPSPSRVFASKPTRAPTPAPSPNLAGVPTCVFAQLRFRYLAGGVGTGDDFGTITVTNGSGTPCAWRGSVRVTPLTRTFAVIATSATLATGSPGILLSAHGQVVARAVQSTGDHWGMIDVGGDARDDPRSPNGLCARADEVKPVYWRVATAGGVRAVVNLDRSRRAVTPDGYPGVVACRADFLNVAVDASG